jgi:hypothetical protein
MTSSTVTARRKETPNIMLRERPAIVFTNY